MVKCGFYKNSQYVKFPVVDIHVICCLMQSLYRNEALVIFSSVVSLCG